MNLAGINKRSAVLAVALLLTLAATAYVWHNDLPAPSHAVSVLVVEHHVGLRLPLALQASPDLGQQMNGRKLSAVINDIFSVKKVPEVKAPPPPPVELQPAPPVFILPPPIPQIPSAPPLPFSYLGKLGEGGQYTVFLLAQNKGYAVKVGDIVAQMYHIDEIKPPLMTLTYLPMKIKQTMPIGEAN